MTVKQLKEALSGYPDTMDVFIRTDGWDFDHEPLETIVRKRLIFSEGTETGPVAFDEVIVLDSEV